MNLFGHGIALSSDYIIQAAPKLTADAAGIPVGDVISASIPLTMTMGVVTTVAGFYFLRKDIKSGAISIEHDKNDEGINTENKMLIKSKKLRRALALLIVVLFTLDIVIMFKANLQGGDATALIGGTAVFIFSLISVLAHKKDSLEKITEDLVKGLQFGFKIFGIVIPVAAFFYLGDAAFFDIFERFFLKLLMGKRLRTCPCKYSSLNSAVSSVTLTAVGAITGLDGSDSLEYL